MIKFLLPFALASSALHAADKEPQPTWTDPAKALAEDPDFAIQGEYFDKDSALGAQVVALGDGKFNLYLLAGGLPGQGWSKDMARAQLPGQMEEGFAVFPTKDGHSAHIEEQKITIKQEGKEGLVLPRVERKSPTLEAKAPDGAVVLFDGTDVAQWENGKMENGLLLSTGALSKPTFGDHSLHLEFLTPYRPFARGQDRGNSGVYFGGRWETQVLDSFALEGLMNECGGIYSIAPPSVNACLPPLTWQTYDVDFTDARFDEEGQRTAWPRMTVKLNGVVIHDDQELDKDFTTAAPKSGPLTPEGRPVFIQDHGNPVFFRNIWVLPAKK